MLRKKTFENNKEYYSTICRYGALMAVIKQKFNKNKITEVEYLKELNRLQTELEQFKGEYNGKDK